jgi:hypothetical protein
VEDHGKPTLDPQELLLEDSPEMLELEDEFAETGLQPVREGERGSEAPLEQEPALATLSAEEDRPEPVPEFGLEPVPERRRDRVLEGLLSGEVEWCRRCGVRHSKKACLGEILAAEPERHGWRIAVDTPTGRVVHGVLIAPTGDYWRARIMTFPRTLWVVPDGKKTLKFLGSDPGHAERQAIAFIQEHCRNAGHSVVDDPALVAEPDPVELEQTDEADEAEANRRKLRSVLVRFGPSKPDRRAKTADLSEKGLYVATKEPYARGTHLRLVLEVSGARIPLSGVVQWTRTVAAPGRPEGMGIRLLRPPAFYVQYVRRLP